MSLGWLRTGLICAAVASSLSACGSSPSPPPVTHPEIQVPYLAKATIVRTFQEHGILLQKTFGDDLQTSYDGISASSLGLHVVGLIVYPRQKQGAVTYGGGAGNPIVVANVDIWLDPGLPRRSLAGAKAAIMALTTACGCTSPSLATINGLAVVASGTWHGKRWTLKAGDIADGQYCVELTTSNSPTLQTCGSIQPQSSSRYFQNIGVDVPLTRLGLPAAVVGPIISTAREVEITFTDGTSETVPTIAPPPALNPGIRFYVARRPCRATFTTIIGLDAQDRVVAQATQPARRLALLQVAREAC